jgi:hypothetical protein
VGSRGASSHSHADLFWARMRGESGRAEGARVGARRRGNGTSDNKTLPEYSPRPACDGGGHRATAGTPTQNAACACGVGSSGRLDATGCACGTGPAAAGALFMMPLRPQLILSSPAAAETPISVPCNPRKNRRTIRRVCVYYCRTYYKAVRGGGGGECRTCAMRDDEPRPVWMSLLITH